MKRVKIILTVPGGGSKTEIQPARKGGWAVRGFEYSEDGKRSKVAEHEMTDAQVLDLIREDSGFYAEFEKLAAAV